MPDTKEGELNNEMSNNSTITLQDLLKKATPDRRQRTNKKYYSLKVKKVEENPPIINPHL